MHNFSTVILNDRHILIINTLNHPSNITVYIISYFNIDEL